MKSESGEESLGETVGESGDESLDNATSESEDDESIGNATRESEDQSLDNVTTGSEDDESLDDMTSDSDYNDSDFESMASPPVWALEVDDTRLGARIEAYVLTKAQITTFRLVVQNYNLGPLHSLPAELVEGIFNELKDLVYKDRMAYWSVV